MPTPREVLNRLKWSSEPDASLVGVEVWYRHRGAPGDVRVVKAAAITELGASFFHLAGPHGGASIPYHRVLRITRGDETLYVRRGVAEQ